MTTQELIALVSTPEAKQSIVKFYRDNAPDKHTQENWIVDGVAVVKMNYDLLADWVENNGGDLDSLPVLDQRAVWDASNMHFGIHGYEKEDEDYFWSRKARPWI